MRAFLKLNSMLDVGRWMFDVPFRIFKQRTSNTEHRKLNLGKGTRH